MSDCLHLLVCVFPEENQEDDVTALDGDDDAAEADTDTPGVKEQF